MCGVQLVTVEQVRRARDVLAGVARVTPVEGSAVLAAQVGGEVWLKCENLQRTGSFKLRGAYLRIAGLSPDGKARGVVAASAGNHAQGVALAARLVGVAATVYMPAGAPLPKIEATRGYGAEVRLVDGTVDDALLAADQHAAEHGAVLVHPFDHPDVIAGQGTVGLEILEQCPQVRTVIAAVGGGGLISGVAVAVKAARPDVTVVGVQAQGAAAYPPSLRAGHPVRLAHYSTMADGIAVGSPGGLTFAHVAALVDEVVTVGEEWLSRALLLCLERAKLLVEPAGVAAVAALLAEPDRYEPPVVAVLSGGNIDPLLLHKVIQHGMAAAARYLSFRVRVPDRPGELARLLALLAQLGANVLDVEHRRTAANLVIGEAEVSLSVETRGEQHRGELTAAIRDAGYRLRSG
jgi:threonine dehydratase